MQSPYYYTNAVFAGNMGVTAQVHPFTVARWQDAKIYNNTIIMDTAYTGGTINYYLIDFDGGIVRFNIYHGITVETPSSAVTEADNITADRDAVSGAESYAELFDDPQSLEAITDPETNFAIKTGGAADTQAHKAGAAGTGYINYTTREHDFPWNEGGFTATNAFTDATGAALSTLTTSAPVQVTGISATGALVEISGAGSPQFRITSDEAGSTVVTDWGDTYAIIDANEWLWLRDTSSGSYETAVSVTINIGTSSDTWSITTAAEAADFITHTDSSTTTDPSASSVYSGAWLNGLSIGANVAGQGLAFMFTTRGTGVAISSATVDGEAAAIVANQGTTSCAAIFVIARASLPDPTQTDVDVTVTLTGGDGGRAGIEVFVIDNPSDLTTPADTATDVTAGTTVDVTIDVPAGGGLIVGLSTTTNASDLAWTPSPDLTEIPEVFLEAVVLHAAAYGNFASTQTNLDVNATSASSLANPRMVAASWTPTP
jgi:hypothetical protein